MRLKELSLLVSRREQLSSDHSIAEHRVLDQSISQYFTLFLIAAIIINIHLHITNIFVHCLVDKYIRNLKNIPSRYI